MMSWITTLINLFLVVYCLVMGVWSLLDSSVPLPPAPVVWMACALAYMKGKG